VSYYVSLPLIFLLALAEASVLPMFRIAGLQPNLVLVLMVAWLVLRGPGESFVLIPFAGLVLGLVDGAPLGTALLGLAPIALLHEVRGAKLTEGGLPLTIVFVIVMTFVFHLAYLLVFTVLGQSGNLPAALPRVVLPTTFLNVAVLLPVYVFVSMSSQEVRRAAYA
jgi:rod shape-determining protein MreD